MQPYIFFSILAAFSFSLPNLINKFTSKHRISDPWILLFYSQFAFLPFLALMFIIFPVSIPSSGWIFILFYAVAFYLGNIFYMKAIYKLDASTFAPFFQFQSAFIAILAYIFLSERFPTENYLLIFIILAGSVLVSLDERMTVKSYLQIGTLFILSQQLFHAFSNLSAGFALKSMNQFTFIFWGDLIAALLTFLTVPLIKGLPSLKISFHQTKPLFAASFFTFIGVIFLFTAFKTNLTISSALSLLTAPIVLILTIIASIFRPELLEHHTAKVYLVRGAGIILILLSAIRLSVGG